MKKIKIIEHRFNNKRKSANSLLSNLLNEEEKLQISGGAVPCDILQCPTVSCNPYRIWTCYAYVDCGGYNNSGCSWFGADCYFRSSPRECPSFKASCTSQPPYGLAT